MNFIIFITSLISFLGTLIVMPTVIKLAIKKRLLTEGGGRNSHMMDLLQTLVVVAITFGLLLSNLFVLAYYLEQNRTIIVDVDSVYLLRSYLIITGSCILLFIVGLADDLTSLSSRFRFLVQLIISFVLCYYGDVRIESLNGLFGIYELPYFVSLVFSMIVTIFIINSFNLTDGLDSLATTLGIYILSSFAVLFIMNNNMYHASFALAGVCSLLAFWFYNRPPAKIFMGDCGSLIIGFIIAYCAIKLCNKPIDFSGNINPVFISMYISLPFSRYI